MNMSRRSFMKATLAAGAFPSITGCMALFGPQKVRLACVGIGCQGWNDIEKFEATGLLEVAALCDTDLDGKQCEKALSLYPKAPRFRDFRSIKFDAEKKQIVGDSEANALLKGSKGTPRNGWEEFYVV